MRGLFGGATALGLGSTAADLPAPPAAGVAPQGVDPIVQLFAESPHLPAPEVPVESENEAELSRRAAAEQGDLLRDHLESEVSAQLAPAALVPQEVVGVSSDAEPLAASATAAPPLTQAVPAEPAASPEPRVASNPRAARPAAKPTLTGIASLLDAPPAASGRMAGPAQARDGKPLEPAANTHKQAASAERIAAWRESAEHASGSQAAIERPKVDQPPPPPSAAIAHASRGKTRTKSKPGKPPAPPRAGKRLPVRALLGGLAVAAALAAGVVFLGTGEHASTAELRPVVSAKPEVARAPRPTAAAPTSAPAERPADPPAAPQALPKPADLPPKAAAEAAPKAQPAPAKAAAVAASARPAKLAASAAPTGSVEDEVSGGDSDKLLRGARKRLASGDAAGAESLARVALLHDHADHHAMEVLAQALIKQQRGAEAIGYTDAMVKKRPKRAPYRVLQGDAKLAAGDKAGAEAAFQAALKLDPQNQDAKRGLGL